MEVTKVLGDIKRFKLSSDYYVIKAIASEMDDDLVSALKYVRRANELSPDLYLELKIASYYESMDLFDRANDIYFKLLTNKGHIAHCYYSLCYNMLTAGDERAAFFYNNKYLKYAKNQDEIDEITSLIAGRLRDNMQDEIHALPDWVTEKASGAFDDAMRLIKLGDIREAIATLSQIPVRAEDGLMALKERANCHYMLDEMEDALKLNLEVLKFQPDDVATIDRVVSLSKILGKDDLQLSHIARLSDISNCDIENAKHLVYSFNKLGEYGPAIERALVCLNENKYDVDILGQIGAAYYNMGDYEKALDYFDRLSIIAEKYSIVTYYKMQAVKMIEKKELKPPKDKLLFIWQVPLEEAMRRIEKIREYLLSLTDENKAEIWQTKEFVTLIKWCFSMAEMKHNLLIAEFVSNFPCMSMIDTIQELLIDSTLPDIMKGQLLSVAACSGLKSSIKLVASNILTEIKLITELDDLPKIFVKAYGEVVAALAFLDVKFEKPLKIVLKKAAKKYIGMKREFKQPNTLAAALVLSIELEEIALDRDTVARIFDCNKSLMLKYKKELCI